LKGISSETDLFFLIPISLNFNDPAPVQYQQVLMSANGGSVSGALAKGLSSIDVAYSGAVAYADRTSSGFSVGYHLRLYPTDDTMVSAPIMMGEGAMALVGSPIYIMWPVADAFYPTVTINYANGSYFKHTFADMPIRIQSESDHNDSINSQIASRKAEIYQLTFGIGGTLGTITAAVVGLLKKREFL
jgi:hypothetical protein